MEREIGRRHALAQRAGKVYADHFGRQEIDGLAQHAGLRLDPADAPADDAEAVDHRGMRIGADQRVGVINPFSIRLRTEHAPREIFEVHLMHDPDPGRHHSERLERLLAPFEKLVALRISLELHLEIQLQRFWRPGEIDLHRMIDDQIHRNERLDDLRVPAKPRDRASHRREIDQQRHPGEILQDDASHDKRDFLVRRFFGVPVRKGANVILPHLFAVAIPQDGLEHDPYADWQPGDFRQARFFEGGQRMERNEPAVAAIEFLQGSKAVVHKRAHRETMDTFKQRPPIVKAKLPEKFAPLKGASPRGGRYSARPSPPAAGVPMLPP